MQIEQVQPENVEKAFNFGAIAFNAGTMIVVMFAALLVNALRTQKADFEIIAYLKGNITRFVVGSTLAVALAALMVLSPDFGTALSLIGVNVEGTPVALGAAIAALVIIGWSGKPKE